jgi:hypothetical protein
MNLDSSGSGKIALPGAPSGSAGSNEANKQGDEANPPKQRCPRWQK